MIVVGVMAKDKNGNNDFVAKIVYFKCTVTVNKCLI